MFIKLRVDISAQYGHTTMCSICASAFFSGLGIYVCMQEMCVYVYVYVYVYVSVYVHVRVDVHVCILERL